MTQGIYAIVNHASRKAYIGSTTSSFSRRWAAHKSCLRRGSHRNPHLQAAWSKYGSDVFEFMVCECVTDMCCLIEREQYWLDKFRLTCPVYNYGALAQHPMLGRKHTDEARAKISRALTGHPCSEETRRKCSQSLMGHSVSEQTRQAVGEANQRRVISEETRCKMRKSRLRYLAALKEIV